MVVKNELVTPERAKELLDTSVGNRVLNMKHVQQLERDMKSGCFKDSNDLICVDSDGHLVNGQHRLTAVYLSGVTVSVYIAYEFDNVGIIDRPKIRTTADTMKMHNIVDPQLCTKEAVGLANCYIKIKFSDYRLWTDTEKEKFIRDNADNILLALNISRKGANHPILKKSSAQSAIFAALNSDVSEEKLCRFAECVNTGFTNGEKESAAIVLRNYLLQPNPLGGELIQRAQAASTEQAIKDFVNGTGRRKAYPTNKHIYIIPETKEEGNGGKEEHL